MLINLLSHVFSGHCAQAADLETTLKAAHHNNFDARLSQEDVQQAIATLQRTGAALLPALAGTASYARNQYPVIVELPSGLDSKPSLITITPRNQLDASLNLTIPLFNGRIWQQHVAASAGTQIAKANRAATLNDVLLLTVRAYYDAQSTAAIAAAAQKALAAAIATQEQVQHKLEIGRATLLQLRRTQADTARAKQTLADAQVNQSVAARLLATLSGLEKAPQTILPIESGVPNPPNLPRPLPAHEASAQLAYALEHRPEMRSAKAAFAQATASYRADAWQYAPEVNGVASQRFTNATGFAGKEALWQAGVQVSWNLFDSFGKESALRESHSLQRQALIRKSRIEQQVRDDVADAQDRLQATQTKQQAARDEFLMAQEAARLAEADLQAGLATAVDLTLALRDAFSAEVDVVRADADWLIAWETLRHALGAPLLEEP